MSRRMWRLVKEEKKKRGGKKKLNLFWVTDFPNYLMPFSYHHKAYSLLHMYVSFAWSIVKIYKQFINKSMGKFVARFGVCSYSACYCSKSVHFEIRLFWFCIFVNSCEQCWCPFILSRKHNEHCNRLCLNLVNYF